MKEGSILAKRVVEISFVVVLMIGLVTGVALVQRQQSLTGSAGFSLSDSKPPNIEIVLPEEGYVARIGDAPISITINAADESTIDSIVINLDGKELKSCSGNFCQTEVDPSELSTGSHAISVTASDLSGNSSIAQRNFTVQ